MKTKRRFSSKRGVHFVMGKIKIGKNKTGTAAKEQVIVLLPNL